MPQADNSAARLTVAMIVRDEEAVLAESLASVRLIADEIAVLDTGSTDQTIALAKQWGAKTATLPWQDDFAHARNECSRLATGQWVLWLDAGERLAAESALDLRSFVDAHAERHKAYLLLVEIPALGRGQSHQQAARVRLVPNRPELRFVGRVRETLEPAIHSAGLATDVAPGKIIRNTRDHDPRRRSLLAQRDIRIASAEMAQTGCQPARLLLGLGEAYLTLGMTDRAVHRFREALVVTPPQSTARLQAYYGLLAASGSPGNPTSQQLATCLEALQQFPEDAQLLMALGHFLQQAGQLELAARAFDAAMRFGKVDLELWHPADLAESAAICLALTCSLQGQLDDARRVLERAVGKCPRSHRLARHLLDVQIRQNDFRGALQTVHRLDLPADETQRLSVAVRGACRAASQQWNEALADLQSAYLGGCKDVIVLRWLTATLCQTGHMVAAEPVLADWEQLDPHDPQLQVYQCLLQRHRQIELATAAELPQPSHIGGVQAGSAAGSLRIDPAEPAGVPPPLHFLGIGPALPVEHPDSAGTR